MITAQDMKEYGSLVRKLRLDRSWTLRDVSLAFDIPSHILSKLEQGISKQEPLELDRSILIEATCHHCGKTHQRHPIKGVVFPAYVCPDCI